MRHSLLGIVFLSLSAVCVAVPSGAVCTADPGSVIANGSFNGNGCWTLNDPNSLVTTLFWSGSFYAEIAGGSTYDAVQLKQNVPVEAGVEYELTFVNWSVPDSTIITIALQRDSDPFEQYGLWRDVYLDGAREPMRFACTTTDPAARFVIFLGHESPDTVRVSLDELRLEPISCDGNDAMINPNFSCNPDYPVGWQWYSSNPASTFGTTSDAYVGAYAAEITNLPGGAFYDAYVQQQGLAWTANRFYLARYWNQGNGSGSTTLTIKNLETGTTPVWYETPVQSDWSVVPFVFRPTESTEAGRMTVYGGTATGDLQLDAFQFVEVPMPDFNVGGDFLEGEFTGDGFADVVYAEKRDRWYLWVSRSNGEDYLPFEFWGQWFGPLTGKLAVGNWNGADADSLQRDDLAIVAQNSPVFIRLSDGNGFVDPGTNPWGATITSAVGEALGGDFNGDGYDDLVTFTLTPLADAHVLTSDGAAFANPVLWHNYFGLNGEKLRVGDFTGDGKDDIVTFLRGNDGAVWVGRSTGTSFVSNQWAGLFCMQNEEPIVGYFNWDAKCDIGTCVRLQDNRKVYVRLSNGSAFPNPSQVWHEYLVGPNDLVRTGDGNGDGLSDITTMSQANVFEFTQSWGGNFGSALTWYTTQEIPFIPEPDEPTTGVDLPSWEAAPRPVQAWNSPNPFTDATSIRFRLPSGGQTTVAVYDASGREVDRLADGFYSAGEHELVWRADRQAAGIYFYRITAGAFTATRKAILVR